MKCRSKRQRVALRLLVPWRICLNTNLFIYFHLLEGMGERKRMKGRDEKEREKHQSVFAVSFLKWALQLGLRQVEARTQKLLWVSHEVSWAQALETSLTASHGALVGSWIRDSVLRSRTSISTGDASCITWSLPLHSFEYATLHFWFMSSNASNSSYGFMLRNFAYRTQTSLGCY